MPATFNSVNPVSVGYTAKVGQYTRVFDNTVALKEGGVALDKMRITEGSAPSAVAGEAVVYASTAHKLMVAMNGGAFGAILRAGLAEIVAADIHAAAGIVLSQLAIPRAVAYHNTTQIASDTGTALELNAEDFDTGTMHDTSSSNSRIVVPETGIYLVIAHSGVIAGSGADVNLSRLRIRVNGTTEYGDAVVGANDNTGALQSSMVLSLSASQYVEAIGYTPTGAGTMGSATRALASSLAVVRVA